MKVLYYDCFCGISGDMNLGALVDLGVDIEYLKDELKKLDIDEEFEIASRKDMKMGISGTKVDVILHNKPDDHNHEHTHEHAHADHDHKNGHSHDEQDHVNGHTHGHSHGNHSHAHSGGKDGKHHHDHRNFAAIRDMIMDSDLAEKVKTMSVEMFRVVAEAEGKVHGKPMEEVHFHEVGATDSIVDIVGSAICIDALGVDKIMASSVHVGGGFVKCAHGMMPVPAPATAEILADVPMNCNIVPHETTTPTGAAILKANVDMFSDRHDMVIHKVGYGLGNKDFDIPNVLRVYLGEIADKAEDLIVERQWMAETNIDDMNPELLAFAENRLFKAGALDVYRVPMQMKKGRSAVKLSVLYTEDCRDEVMDVILTETTAAGLREYEVTKHMLPRSFEDIETPFGTVKVKLLVRNGRVIKGKAEYEDCAKLAEANGIPIHKIYTAANDAINREYLDKVL